MSLWNWPYDQGFTYRPNEYQYYHPPVVIKCCCGNCKCKQEQIEKKIDELIEMLKSSRNCK